VTGWKYATAIKTPASSFVSCLASADVEGDPQGRSERRAGVEGKTLPCPDELDRRPPQILAEVVEQEVEGAVAADDAGEDFAGHRLRRGEQHRLDAGFPFAPAQLRRQVEKLAVEVGFWARPPRHGA